jgi:hypothetical protein
MEGKERWADNIYRGALYKITKNIAIFLLENLDSKMKIEKGLGKKVPI